MYKARKVKTKKKLAVTILGRQSDSNIWALGRSTFIDEKTGWCNCSNLILSRVVTLSLCTIRLSCVS